jgi:hypothetical protein
MKVAIGGFALVHWLVRTHIKAVFYRTQMGPKSRRRDEKQPSIATAFMTAARKASTATSSVAGEEDESRVDDPDPIRTWISNNLTFSDKP